LVRKKRPPLAGALVLSMIQKRLFDDKLALASYLIGCEAAVPLSS
jgi:hypothetical protein